MKVVIAGSGKIGKAIIGSLVNEGHDVVVIDDNKNVISSVSNIYDVMGVCGSATDYETLENAGVSDAELFVAVTSSDEINMLSCFVAKRMGAKYTVARIRNPETSEKQIAFIKQELDISYVINPDLLAAKEIFNILRLPAAVNIETFSRRNFEMIELIVKKDSKLDGVTLAELRKKHNSKFLVCAVRRGDEVYIPGGDFELKAGDKIGITAMPAEIQKLLKQVESNLTQVKNVMVMGASRGSSYLARMLIKSGIAVKLIDMRAERCEEFSRMVPEATVIHGNGAEQEVLLEEGISAAGAFIALTGMDEENILVSCFANSNGVPKVITKVNKTEMASMAEKLGLDTIISPKRIVSDVIVRYARAIKNSMDSNIETLYKLMDGKIEAIEFIVGEEFPYAGIPLKELKIKKNILIAGFLRGRKVVIPSGSDEIAKDDRVIVIAAGENISNLSDIIEN